MAAARQGRDGGNNGHERLGAIIARRRRPFAQTGILFSRPSPLEGAARLFDFANALSTYRYRGTPREADARALRADWEAAGLDVWSALADELEDRMQDGKSRK